jgi:hypothetical protein
MDTWPMVFQAATASQPCRAEIGTKSTLQVESGLQTAGTPTIEFDLSDVAEL